MALAGAPAPPPPPTLNPVAHRACLRSSWSHPAGHILHAVRVLNGLFLNWRHLDLPHRPEGTSLAASVCIVVCCYNGRGCILSIYFFDMAASSANDIRNRDVDTDLTSF